MYWHNVIEKMLRISVFMQKWSQEMATICVASLILYSPLFSVYISQQLPLTSWFQVLFLAFQVEVLLGNSEDDHFWL